MQIKIKTDLFARFARVANRAPSRLTADSYGNLKCVRFEIVSKKTYMIASNQMIASIYYIGENDQPDGVAHICTDDALINQCDVERPFNSDLHINIVPMLNVATVKTSFGYEHVGNTLITDASPRLADWRTWFTDLPQVTNGAMSWTVDDMDALCQASVSGRVVFPEHIDVMRPIIMTDIVDENWAGVFMGNIKDLETGKTMKPVPASKPWWVE